MNWLEFVSFPSFCHTETLTTQNHQITVCCAYWRHTTCHSLYWRLTCSRFSATHSQILGRAVKNEYLALAIYSTVFGGVYLATRGRSTAAPKPTTVQQAKDSVLLNADSRWEFSVTLYSIVSQYWISFFFFQGGGKIVRNSLVLLDLSSVDYNFLLASRISSRQPRRMTQQHQQDIRPFCKLRIIIPLKKIQGFLLPFRILDSAIVVVPRTHIFRQEANFDHLRIVK